MATTTESKEDFYLSRAREHYADGHLDLAQLEQVVTDILKGGRYITFHVRDSPFPKPTMERIAK